MSAVDPAAYELAFSEARRALEDQERVVNELRTRAGVLIAAAAMSTSFFGGAAIADRTLGVTGWIGVLSFVLLGGTVVSVLWPRQDWTFTVDAEDFIAEYLEPLDADPLDLVGIHRDLALHMARSHKDNREQLRRLLAALRAGVLLLVAEVLAWVAALIAQGS